MIIISPELTLFVFILLPIAGYLMGQVGKSSSAPLKAQEQLGTLISIIEETLEVLRIVKAFHAEEMMKKRFEAYNEAYRKTTMGVERRQKLAHPMRNF